MAKKTKSKLGTHADGLTPSARSAANKKANAERSHLSKGDGNVELSENTSMSPSERAASRGAKGVPAKRLPTNPWN